MVKILRNKSQPPKRTIAKGNAKKGSPVSGARGKHQQEYHRAKDLLSRFAGIADSKGRIQFANEATVAELGYSEEEILRKPFWEAEWFSGSEESQRVIREGIERAQEGQTTECRVEAFSKDGTSLPTTLYVGPLKGRDRNVIGIIGMAESVAPDETYEETAKQTTSPQTDTSILEVVQEGYFRTDSVSKITAANPHAARLLGHDSPEDLVGKRIAGFWSRPEEKDRYLMHLSRNAKVSKYAATFRRTDGQDLRVELDVQLLFDGGGDVVGSEGVFRNITTGQDLKKTQDRITQLEEFQEQYEAVIDTLEEGIVLLEKGIIKFANARLGDLLQWDPEEMEGKDFASYLSPSSRKVAAQWEGRGATPEDELPKTLEIELVSRDGKRRSFQALLHYLDSGATTTHMLMLRDIPKSKTPEASPGLVQDVSEESLRRSDCGVIVVRNAQISFANQKVYELLGYGPEDLEADEANEGQSYSTLMDSLGNEVLADIAQRHNRRGAGISAPWNLQPEITDSEGLLLSVALEGSAVDYEGQPAELILVRPLSDQEETLDELRKSEEYLQAILGSTGAAIIVIDPESHEILDVNARAVEMIGASQEELLGQLCHGNVCPAQPGECPVTDLDQILCLSRHVLPKGDGEEIPVFRTATLTEWQGQSFLIESLLDSTLFERMEEALEGSEGYYRGAVQAAPLAILSLNPQGETIMSTNTAFEKITGWSTDEWLGRPFKDIVHPDDLSAAGEGLQEAMRGEQPSPRPMHLRTASDEFTTGEALFACQTDKEGQSTVFVFFWEAPEREVGGSEAEDGLALKLMDKVSEGLHIVSTDGTIQYGSPSTQGIFGYSPRQTAGKNLFDFLHPEDASSTIEAFNSTLEDPETTVSLRFRFRHVDDSWVAVQATVTNLVEEPTVQGITVTYRQEALRKGTQKPEGDDEGLLSTLVDNLLEAVQVVDSQGVIEWASPANEAIFGRDIEDMVGCKAFEAVHPEDAVKVVDIFNSLLQNPGEAATFECRLLNEDGSWHYLQASATNLIEDPAMEGLLLRYYDITDQKRIEADLHDSQDRLQDTLDEILASHDDVSVPVTQAWEGILLLPLVGVVDAERARQIADVLLKRIVASKSQIVLLDVSGIRNVDAEVIGHLAQTVQSSSLLGAQCIITGMDPELASDMEIKGGKRKRPVIIDTLQEGIAHALKEVGYGVSTDPEPLLEEEPRVPRRSRRAKEL
jgi:PAS domain S-box-containing protein